MEKIACTPRNPNIYSCTGPKKNSHKGSVNEVLIYCITFLMVTPKWFDSKYQSLSKIVPFRIIQGLSLRFHVEGYLPLVGGDLNN